VGPDLTLIGSQKDRAYILESIVFPNKHIAQGFQIVVLEMKDGSTVAGRLISDSPSGLEVETVNDQGKNKDYPG
jgi:quinoprotein glucose dehydrogenase